MNGLSAKGAAYFAMKAWLEEAREAPEDAREEKVGRDDCDDGVDDDDEEEGGRRLVLAVPTKGLLSKSSSG
jgi:hypothetical protein